MRITQYSTGGHILIELTPATPGEIIPLVTFGASPAAVLAKADPNLRGIMGRLVSLRAIATIISIDQVALPEFELLDNDTERLVKALAVQWTSPRKQLGIYHSTDGGVNWIKVGAQSLINSSGYPYSTHDLLNFLTGESGREYPDGSGIGIRLEDVGTGLLGVGDKVVIDGSFVEVFTMGEGVSSVGSITVPDLTTVEAAIQTLNAAITAQGETLTALDTAIQGINTVDISARLEEIQYNTEGAMGRRSESSTEQQINVTTTNTQLVAADVGARLSVVIVHAGTTGTLYLRTGPDAATTTAWVAKLEPGDLIEFATGEAVQAVASETIPVNVTEVS